MSIALLADLAGNTPAGGLARALRAQLEERATLTVYGPGIAEPASLRPRGVQRILAVVDDDPRLAAVARAVRRNGGVVVLMRWELPALALALRPALAHGGLGGRLAAWREGGMEATRRWTAGGAKGLALNRSVVRFADGFVVPDEACRRAICAERNAPTPVLVCNLGDPAVAARLIVEELDRFPPHPAARRSLLGALIAEADRARAARGPFTST